MAERKPQGRHRTAAGRDVSAARARGVDLPRWAVTAFYGLADDLDRIERTGDDPYLRPQLVRAAMELAGRVALWPEVRPGEELDPFAAITEELGRMMAGAADPAAADGPTGS